MKRMGKLLIGLVVLVVLLANMVTYRVRYNEIVIVTTFGAAKASSVKVGDGERGGLYFRWPWPIEEVARVYDARVHVLEDRPEEQQTLDKQNIIVNTYVAWKIEDPLAFFRTLNTVDQAERQLRDRLRDARAQIGKYTFNDLTNVTAEVNKLAEAEDLMLQRMQEETSRQAYGVKIESVGIKGVQLAESVSEKVFAVMRSTRLRLAQRARSEGDAAASDLRAKAKSAEKRILAFAERRAADIRAEGEAAAAEYYTKYRGNEELALLLRKLEGLKASFLKNTTFILEAGRGPLDLLDSLGSEGTDGPNDVEPDGDRVGAGDAASGDNEDED